MNRQFTLDATPAKARILCTMANETQLELSGDIRALADEERISSEQFAEHGLADPVDQAAVQFIIDHNFRAGLPHPIGQQNRVKDIVEAALAIGNIPDEDVLSLESLSGYSYLDLISHRRKVLLINTGKHDEIPTMAGKCFPRIILYGSITIQYSFLVGNGQQMGTADTMGAIISPMVEATFGQSTYKRSQPRAQLAMGVYPYLVPADGDLEIERKFKKVLSQK